MRVAILGYGLEGKSIHKFLKSSPDYRGAKIKILDQKFDKNYLKNLDQFDIVFRSPGVPYNLPEIQKAIKRGVRFSSATQLFFEELRGTTQTARRQTQKNVKLIGITGTKGKGTTSTLLYKILKNSGFDAYLAGNIGKPAIEILPKLSKNSWVILELSSFQLQDLNQSPHIAAVLDIFPDHLDSHKNFKEYINAKANISRFQNSKQNKIFYFPDNKFSRWIADQSPAQKIAVSPEIMNLPDLQIPGGHNRKNAAMAKAIAQHLVCPDYVINQTIANFKGLEHRLEFVQKIMIRQARHKNKSAIYFYNDSASTNPQTSAAAILAFASKKSKILLSKPHTLNPIILIAGGKDKNLNYKPLADAIKKSEQVKLAVLIGENKKKIKQTLSRAKVPVINTKNLESAVKLAYQKAQKLINSSTHKLITVLFSPGAASFDMFKDYKDRGRKFQKIVRSLKP